MGENAIGSSRSGSLLGLLHRRERDSRFFTNDEIIFDDFRSKNPLHLNNRGQVFVSLSGFLEILSKTELSSDKIDDSLVSYLIPVRFATTTGELGDSRIFERRVRIEDACGALSYKEILYNCPKTFSTCGEGLRRFVGDLSNQIVPIVGRLSYCLATRNERNSHAHSKPSDL